MINFGIPASYETYIHRIGRTGRAGRTGTAISILEPREHRHLRAIEGLTKTRIEIQSVPSVTDVRAKRLEALRDSLVEVLDNEDLERFKVVVEELCEDHDPLTLPLQLLRSRRASKVRTTMTPIFQLTRPLNALAAIKMHVANVPIEAIAVTVSVAYVMPNQKKG